MSKIQADTIVLFSRCILISGVHVPNRALKFRKNLTKLSEKQHIMCALQTVRQEKCCNMGMRTRERGAQEVTAEPQICTRMRN